MKLPLSFSPRQALLLVILIAVVGLLLARRVSNRVPEQPIVASGSATTETPVHPTKSDSNGLTSEAAAPEAVAALHGAPTGISGSTSTDNQGPQVATASSASTHPEATTELVTGPTEPKQQVAEPAEHAGAHESDRGERKGEREEKERKQDQPDEAMKWRMGSLVDETGKIPEGAEVRAWLHKKQMPIDPSAWPAAAVNATDTVAGLTPTGWQWLGPGNIGGRVRSIIIHPNDPQTLWLGSVSGGIWKTTDGGASWQPLADFLTNLAVSSMVIDPTNPNVLYAGTGEGYFNGDSIRGAGVFKTTDGGATWNQLLQTAASPNWYYVDRLAISPADNQVLLAATRSGVWRSADGGTTWSRRLTTSFMFDVNFDPTEASKAIASGDNGTIRYSTDGGLTWNPATGISGSRIEVAYARSSPNIVYASVENGQGQVYKSTDGGQSYSLINGTSQHLQDQGWYDNALWVDPTNPNNIVVGGITLFRSTNGGANFSQIGSVHADQHIIIEAPGFDGVTNKTVYFGNDGGIYRTTDINAGFVNTTELNNNLGITQFYGAAGNVSSGRIVGGTQDNGTLRYLGNTETWDSVAGGDGGWCASDPTNPNFFFGEFQWLQLHRSIDGGGTAQSIYQGITDAVPNGTTNFIAPFILDPNNPNTLLAGGANLWRSNNAKGSPLNWTIIKTTIGSNISAIAVANGNSDIVWVGHNNGNIFVTTNGTAASPTWTQVNMPAAGRRNTRITIDPTNSNRVYVTFGGYAAGNVWRTDNAGASFVNITNNLPIAPVRSLVVWQNNPNYLYVGTEVGVFASANGGQTWSPSNDGPTNCSVDELFWMGNTLVAATHGRGMFSINLSTGQPPSVTLTSPANGAGFNGGAQVTIAADASDADGTVAKVDFFVNNTLIGTATTAPYSVVWNNVPIGTHTLMARVADNSGDTALSTAININVSWAVCTGMPIILGQTIIGTHAETDCSAPIGNRNDSYIFDASAGQTVAITMTAGFFDTRLVLMAPSGAEIASDDNGNGGTDSRIPAGSGFVTLPSSGIYKIVATSAVVGLQSGGPYALTLVGGPSPSTVQFSTAGYSINESGGAFNATVMRTGSTASVTTVKYRTSDTAGLDNCNVLNGNASARCDYTTVVGTVRFEAGQTSKNISIPIIDDSYAEATESFMIVLSDITGGSLGASVTAILTINDNEISNGPNPIDGTPFFIRQQYLDFLNREPDPDGYAAWQQVINNCPAGDTTCDRIHVSSAFFRSPEFQDRGYFVYRLYPVAFGRKPDFAEFVPDIAKVSGFLSDAELEAAKVAFIAELMSRPAFVAKFNGLTDTQYVDTLLATAGVTSPDRNFYITALGNGTRTRAAVLREIVESSQVYNKYFNQAFVVMQYFGYLRRDPDAFYLDWIQALNTSGDFRGMVNGFMNSLEYRFRFGP
jgi:Bacterial Ig domain/Calx-beta domain/Domain of unknown function (DUF4214)